MSLVANLLGHGVLGAQHLVKSKVLTVVQRRLQPSLVHRTTPSISVGWGICMISRNGPWWGARVHLSEMKHRSDVGVPLHHKLTEGAAHSSGLRFDTQGYKSKKPVSTVDSSHHMGCIRRTAAGSAKLSAASPSLATASSLRHSSSRPAAVSQALNSAAASSWLGPLDPTVHTAHGSVRAPPSPPPPVSPSPSPSPAAPLPPKLNRPTAALPTSRGALGTAMRCILARAAQRACCLTPAAVPAGCPPAPAPSSGSASARSTSASASPAAPGPGDASSSFLPLPLPLSLALPLAPFSLPFALPLLLPSPPSASPPCPCPSPPLTPAPNESSQRDSAAASSASACAIQSSPRAS